MKTESKKIVVILSVIMGLFISFQAAKAITVYPAIFEFNTVADTKLADTLQIYNESNTAITVAADVENFLAKGESGEQNFIPGNYGLASWISLSKKELNLEPGEKKSVSFKINLPQTPAPGAYSAGILWHEVNKPGNEVNVVNRVGALVLLSIAGDSKINARLVEFGTDKSFFEKLPVNFTVRIANEGNTLIKPVGEIIIKNIFGRTVDALEINSFGNALLPDSVRRFETKWDSTSLAFGRYTAELRAKYGAEGKIGGEINFWVMPWKQIVVVAAGILLLAIIYAKTLGKIRRVRKNII